MSDKVFFVDVAHCVGCYNCQIVCKDEHVGNDWMPYTKPQMPIGEFWIRVEEHVCGTIPKVKMHYIVHVCGHCEHAACMEACPEKAIYRRENGIVIIDPKKCTGCKQCIPACPYGSIYFNDDEHVAQKCTGCMHLLDNGEKVPRCVDACPTDALMFGTYEELKDKLKNAERLESRNGCIPKVWYAGIPGRFVAGTVYDPVEKEVIIGAECVLEDGGDTWTAVTDDFGDFWLKDVPQKNSLTLRIRAEGYRPMQFFLDTRTKDVNLGDIPLSKT